MDKQELNKKIIEVSKSIFSYCIARTSNQQDAQDLAQDIVVEIIKSSQNIRDDKAFYSFMWSIAGNVYKQWYRKKLRFNESELSDDIQGKADDLEDLLADYSDIYLLRRELTLLSEKYRRVTVLYYLKNKSCSEIAKITLISESMVKYLLFKSRKILKEGMNMQRSYGEQSYNPKNLNLLYMGEGPNKYWELLYNNKIRQNILWSCYNDNLTDDEIALQIGISLPYIESDINTLTDTWLLKKDGNRYRTNIIILTDDFEQEKATKLLSSQKEISEIIKDFIDNNITEINKIGFYGCEMSLNSLRWHIATMMLFYAYSVVGDKMFSNDAPITAFGEHAYLWGAENIKGGFNCCSIKAEEWKTTIDMFFMDWTDRSNISHNDFYSNKKWIKVFDKIARGNIDDFNEFEQEITAEMVRKGYIIRKDDNIISTMPVYTSNEYNNMVELQKQVVFKIGNVLEKLHKTITGILKNHVPTHLKSQVELISAMILFNDVTFSPTSILIQNNYLSTNWIPTEVPTSYAVLR